MCCAAKFFRDKSKQQWHQEPSLRNGLFSRQFQKADFKGKNSQFYQSCLENFQISCAKIKFENFDTKALSVDIPIDEVMKKLYWKRFCVKKNSNKSHLTNKKFILKIQLRGLHSSCGLFSVFALVLSKCCCPALGPSLDNLLAVFVHLQLDYYCLQTKRSTVINFLSEILFLKHVETRLRAK